MDSSNYFGSNAVSADFEVRKTFLRRTYGHVFGAAFLFVLISSGVYESGASEALTSLFLGGGRLGWLLVIGGFSVLSWIANSMTQVENKATNYLGLGMYTALEALIFSPLIFIAAKYAPGVLPSAAIITLLAFSGLTIYALTMRTDFSFLRPILMVGGFVALGMIVCGAIFGFSMGIWFSGAMILFSVGSILYSTSRVMHNYRPDQYVAAALELFAALALMLWYVISFLLQSRRD